MFVPTQKSVLGKLSRYSSALKTNQVRASASQTMQEPSIVQQPLITPHDSFKSSDIKIVKCLPHELKHKPEPSSLIFGHNFTDHMLRCDWDKRDGWSAPQISKLANFNLHPASKVLHYAPQIFEGCKAYRGYDNKIRFFRLDEHIKRLARSAKRSSLPSFNEAELIDIIHKIVAIDQSWIPKVEGQQLNSLYIRPLLIGTDPSLGVAESQQAILSIILCPVGSYFKTGFKPVTLYADPKYVRAWTGGAGAYKLGANYAPTIEIQKEAEVRGFQQVLWLFDKDLKITEVGTMNVFVCYKKKDTGRICVVTPSLVDGLILPGITRKSIIELVQGWSDLDLEERYMTMDELRQIVSEGRLVEMFGSGTACTVCPISSIQVKDEKMIYMTSSLENQKLSISNRILKAITDIQYGKMSHSWAQELIYHE